MSQPVLKLNVVKNRSGAANNANATKSQFGASFPNAELLSYVQPILFSHFKCILAGSKIFGLFPCHCDLPDTFFFHSQLTAMGYSVKRAGKALVETNNKDLASALDWCAEFKILLHEYFADDFSRPV